MSHPRFEINVHEESILTTLHTHDLLGEYLLDVSNVASLYALTHEYAIRKPRRHITINLQQHAEEVLLILADVFSEYPALLPNTVTLKMTINERNIVIPGKGESDRDFHANACYLVELAEIKKHRNGGIVNAALGVDFREFLTYRSLRNGAKALALMLDADDCMFNANYRVGLLKLMFSHLDKIKTHALTPDDDTINFSHELLGEISKLDFSTITDAEVDEWINYINQEGVCTDQDFNAEYSRPENRFVTICRQYIRYLNKISPAIMTHILFRANEELFERTVRSAEQRQCAGIVVKSFSARQSVYEDYLNCRENGTCSFLSALPELVAYLNQHYRDRMSFVHDGFLMPDAYHNLPYGKTYKHALTIAEPYAHPYSVLDPSKLALLMVSVHYLKHRYDGIDLTKIVDDRLSVFEGYIKFFNDDSALSQLPDDMSLEMFLYDGQLSDAEPFRLAGCGVVERDITLLAKQLAQFSQCDLSNLAKNPFVHNIGVKIDKHGFILHRSRVPLRQPVVQRLPGTMFQPIIHFHHPHMHQPRREKTVEKSTHKFH